MFLKCLVNELNTLIPRGVECDILGHGKSHSPVSQNEGGEGGVLRRGYRFGMGEICSGGDEIIPA